MNIKNSLIFSLLVLLTLGCTSKPKEEAKVGVNDEIHQELQEIAAAPPEVEPVKEVQKPKKAKKKSSKKTGSKKATRKS